MANRNVMSENSYLLGGEGALFELMSQTMYGHLYFHHPSIYFHNKYYFYLFPKTEKLNRTERQDYSYPQALERIVFN